ncbi:Hydroxymethylpyrimidine kinase [Alteripontixanthobacter maritimus]|uniref:hydroxymethylpyrimidine kinase n=1 Tax=Alteripontixanthobacter maritimus TaxID=2161824 RepID=A0A369QAH7_9SPHN|nr:bifunctional hydroxymethylpyrimidine kinase/phosphomethylpyrimidine kinase [Alteripontixanthobacter maritimus]RDC60525.1 Hydroxymethylpyrimidine kinase [Alteripontixanthobacter maritimus]
MTDAGQPRTPPRILSIAGSDSSGGAGIQADIKTVTMLGGYAMTAITALTAQNSVGVQAIEPVSPDFVSQQITSCAGDIGIDAVKIGMLATPDVIHAVADALAALRADNAVLPIVLDPVMVATSGARLIEDDAVAAMVQRLFPLATIITPNLPELRALSDDTAPDDAHGPLALDTIAKTAGAIARKHGAHVLAKGGHAEGSEADGDRVFDLLIDPEGRWNSYNHARLETRHTHGSGCTLSSAIATFLGYTMPMEHAVRLARQFVFAAIQNAPGFGAGSGPMGHQAVRNGGG